jgi:hypothetical protein
MVGRSRLVRFGDDLVNNVGFDSHGAFVSRPLHQDLAVATFYFVRPAAGSLAAPDDLGAIERAVVTKEPENSASDKLILSP